MTTKLKMLPTATPAFSPVDTTQPIQPISAPTHWPETPEAAALALLYVTLPLAPNQRQGVLDLYTECLRTVTGDRERRGGLH